MTRREFTESYVSLEWPSSGLYVWWQTNKPETMRISKNNMTLVVATADLKELVAALEAEGL